MADRSRQFHGGFPVLIQGSHFSLHSRNRFPRSIEQGDFQPGFPALFRRIIVNIRRHVKSSLLQLISLKSRGQVKIAQAQLGCGHQIHIPVNTAQTEHILIFEITTIAPAIHFGGHRILTRLHISGDIEFSIVIRSLAISHFLPVHPQIHGTIHTIEMDKNLIPFPIGGNGKLPAVRPYRIRLDVARFSTVSLYERRIIPVRISDIRINWRTVTIHFPIGRHGNFSPLADIVIRLIEIHRTFGRLFHPVELPVTVQRQIPGRLRSDPLFLITWIGLQFGNAGKRHKRSPARLFIHRKYLFIFPIVYTTGF